MKRKGFTLVELLAVIAILAILVIIALPNVLKMYNNAKKNSFLAEVKTLAQDVSSKYITESMKGNKLTTISNKQNSLDLSGRDIEYSFDLDEKGKIKRMMVYDGTYCVVTTKDYTNLKTSDVSESCSYDEIHNIVGTLSKNFYEKSGKTDRILVKSIEFYSDGRTISGAESYDVSEKGDNSIIMYVKQNSENSSLLDLTVVANGTIAFPKNSSYLLSFFGGYGCQSGSKLSLIEFNHAIDTSNVTDMSWMFAQASSLTIIYSSPNHLSDPKTGEPPMGRTYIDSLEQMNNIDLSDFDTSKVTNMEGMFAANQSTVLDLSTFDTSNVTNMNSMFECTKLEKINVNNFNTSKVIDMSNMFSRTNAKQITGLEKFNTSKVFDMSEMFYYSSASNLNLANFDTSNVTNMRSMFDGSQVEKLDLSSFDTSKVEYMNYMFLNSPNLRTIYVSDKFKTNNDTNTNLMFKGVPNLVGGAGTVYDSTKTDKTYARIDGGASNPGYFTKK